MKVCLVTENYEPSYGGQFTAVNNIANICKFKNLKYNIIHKKSKIFENKKFLEKTIISSDIIHIFGGWTLFYFRIHKLAIKFKKKIIIHTMGLFEPKSFEQKTIKKKLAWSLYQEKILLESDLLHCGSKTEEKNLKNLNEKFKTIILPFSIDKKNINKNFNKNITKKCLYFSRLHNQKGLDKLIKAWININNKDWKLDIIGFGNAKYYIKKFNLTNYKNIKFLKPIINKNKKIKLFDNYDFFVLPSRSESFGLAILESLARRVPVLTTNNTPWLDIQKKNSGWIINNSLIELKLVLYEIFNSSNMELILKKHNTIKIVKNYTTTKISKLYVKAYKKLISNNNN